VTAIVRWPKSIPSFSACSLQSLVWKRTVANKLNLETFHVKHPGRCNVIFYPIQDLKNRRVTALFYRRLRAICGVGERTIASPVNTRVFPKGHLNTHAMSSRRYKLLVTI